MTPTTTAEAQPEHAAPKLPATRLTRQNLFAKLAGAMDVWVTVLLLCITVLPPLLGKSPLLIYQLDYLDNSWEVDLVQRARAGEWLGKQLVFTYGPLFQWLFSRAPLAYGGSAAATLRWLWTFQYWSIIVCVYGFAAFLLRHEAAWKRAFLVAVVVIFWAANLWWIFELKLLFPLACLAMFIRFVETAGSSPKRRLTYAAVSALAISTGCLISIDCGIYSAAAFGCVLVASALFSPRERGRYFDLVAFALATVVILALSVVAINTWAASPFDFSYWRTGRELLSNYRWSQAEPMKLLMLRALLFLLGACLCVFAVGLAIARKSLEPRRNTARWLAMLLYFALCLETALVFSEWNHLVLAFVPVMVMCVGIILGAVRSGESAYGSGVAVIVVLLLTGIFTGANHQFRAASLRELASIRNVTPCPLDTEEVEGICIEPHDAGRISAVTDYLKQHTAASDQIIVHQWESIYGPMAGRRVAGTVLQNYLVVTPELAKLQTASYQAARPPIAIYTITGDWGDENSFTRTPELWFYLQRWYRLDQFVGKVAQLLLRRDEAFAAGITQTVSPIALEQNAMSGDRELKVKIEKTSSAPDFIRIRLRADYPLWWQVLKPAHLEVTLHFVGADDVKVVAHVRPNQPFEVWINPWGEKNLENYFRSDPAKWRPIPRQPIDSMTLQFSRADWANVLPSHVSIDAIDAMSLGYAPPAQPH